MRTKKTVSDKPNKNLKTKNIHSALDRFYTTHVEELEQEKRGINKKKQLLKKKQVEYNTSNQGKYLLEMEIKDLEKEINYIESGDKMTDYIMKVCHIVCEYSDINEKIGNGMASENELGMFIDRKHKLVQEYCSVMKLEYHYSQGNDNNIANKCNNCDTVITDTIEGFLVCLNCGSTKTTIEVHNTPSFKEAQEHNYKPTFSYQKSSHFQDHMKYIQGKETHEIPDEIINKILVEINKLRVTETSQLTYKYLRDILKKLDEPKYYKSIPRIIYKISGMQPLQLTAVLEEKLHKCFLQIVDTFENNFKGSRKSMISYPYILSKLFQMFGLDEYRKLFPVLKACKLREHDEIYRKIVQDIAAKDPETPWTFTPSI